MTRLVTASAPGAAAAAALVLGDELLLLAGAEAALGLAHGAAPIDDLASLFARGPSLRGVFDRLRRIADAGAARADALRERGLLLPAATCRIGAPIVPRLIVCSGNTYARHVQEMGGAAPSHPGGFLKSPHCVIGPGTPIELPASHPAMVDFEGEFALVVGRACHRVDARQAADCIAGYTLVNDISARDWVGEAKRSGDMFFNTLGKQFPGFCPIGPAIVTADTIGELAGLRLTTRLNGREMQNTLLGQLLFTPAHLLEFWSRWYAFRPGDVITTGSPPGVGFARTPPVFLAPGDRLEVAVAEIGVLDNPVVAAAADAPRRAHDESSADVHRSASR